MVCGDGEYIIYTALAWRNRSFGSALEFVWSSDGEYAVRESTSRIKLFSKNFQVHRLPSLNLLFFLVFTSSYKEVARAPLLEFDHLYLEARIATTYISFIFSSLSKS